jgi:hypothetical protein
MAARRQAIRESKDRPEAPAVLKPSWKSDLPAVPPQLHNFCMPEPPFRVRHAGPH